MLLRSFVAEEFVDDIDFSNLKRLNSSFVTEEFRERESDILWEATLQGQTAYIYILIEFQSTVDRFMALRLLTYILLLYQSMLKVQTPDRLPAVSPIVLYNGDDRWTALRRSAALDPKEAGASVQGRGGDGAKASRMTSRERLYRTQNVLTRTLRVAYPAGDHRMTLRTEQDWEADVAPQSVSEDGTVHTFELTADQPFLYLKPVLWKGSEPHWSVGPNKLLLMTEEDNRICYPHFFHGEKGTFSKLIEFHSPILDRNHRVRVYVPPGYQENTLSSYPVAYMQDGQNLFFPAEAFLGRDWEVDEANTTLRSMSAIEDYVIVGIYSGDRMNEYTKPGYENYARSLVEEIVPQVDARARVGRHRRYRSVWGSSLGGVVSFYTVWEHPDVFGAAVCMSSTFSHRDDLMDRVLNEPTRDVAFYLDSGWPGDNYEVTVGMAMALIARGFRLGHNLMHLCFPHAEHDEHAWGMRLHLPIQMLNGAVARASRAKEPVLKD